MSQGVRAASPGQWALMPRHPVLLPKLNTLTPRKLALLPQVSQANRYSNSVNTPRGLQEATHWKTPTLNGSSIYLVNLSPRLKGQYQLKALTLQLPGKQDIPLRHVLSSCGSVIYGVATELTKIPKPLIGKSPHHINSTHDFVEQVKHLTLAPGECLSSYDVSALVHLSPSRSNPKGHQGSIGKRPHPQGKNSTPHGRHHSTIRVFS